MKIHWSAQSKNSNVSGSLAWLPDSAPDGFDTSQVVHFCDGRTCDRTTTHNIEMDNIHNRICNRHATFDVILSNWDFFGRGTPPRPGLDTTPEFIIVHDAYEGDEGGPTTSKTTTTTATTTTTTKTTTEMTTKEATTTLKPANPYYLQFIVLVLDQSGSMEGDALAKMKSAAYQFVELLDAYHRIAIVTFDHVAYKISDFEKGNKKGKERLAQRISSIEAGGFTCIQSGLNLAIEMLKDEIPVGGSILLMSDGENTRCGTNADVFSDNFLPDSIGPVLSQGTTVHTVAITDEADRNLEEIARLTGGLSFLIANSNNLNSFLVAFQSALIEMTQDDVEQCQIIQTSTLELSPGSETIVPLLLDTGLTDTNLVSVFYDPGLAPVTGTIIPPSVSTAGGITCSDIPDQNRLLCEFDFKPEPGQWKLKIRSSSPFSSYRKEFTVSAASVVDSSIQDTFQIKAEVYADKFMVGNTGEEDSNWWKGEGQNMQVIVASVSYGQYDVLEAQVEAVVEMSTTTNESVYHKQWIVRLVDDGKSYENSDVSSVDLYKNDGTYSGTFNLDSEGLYSGRYSVTIRVVGLDGTTFYVSDCHRLFFFFTFNLFFFFFNQLENSLLGFPKSDNFIAKNKAEKKFVSFQRELQIQSFQVREEKSTNLDKGIITKPIVHEIGLQGLFGERDDERNQIVGTERKLKRKVKSLADEKIMSDLSKQLPPGRVSQLRIASVESDIENTVFTFSWIAVAKNGLRADSGKRKLFSYNYKC